MVFALEVRGNTVYTGGVFTNVGGQPRDRLAALDATTGLATAWNPGADSDVQTLAVSDTMVLVGGNFNIIGDSYRGGFAILQPAPDSTPTSTVYLPLVRK